MRRRGLMLAMVWAGVGLVPCATAAERLPYPEIVDGIRALAAEHLGRKKSDVNTVESLFAQGMRESTLEALVVAIQDEFGVVIPHDEIRQAKWNDPATGLSVRRLADIVEKHMRAPM
jgi:acyl carrier protein